MNRKLAIIFSLLIILSMIIMEAWMLWPEIHLRYPARRSHTKLITFLCFISTGFFFIFYHTGFLVMQKKIKGNINMPSRNFAARIVTIGFGISIFLWFVLWLIVLYF
ncbi:hypothetical protein EGI32_12825 [Ferruginibacter sp. HRS2-29]|nr:hypothetical protein [Ferruginibacter sp. HRS2-29]